MTERRFTDKPELNPQAVWSLPDVHPAMVEGRTLFPSTVVDVTEDFSDRLLVSGENNRKLGKMVTKGRFKGYHLFGLSLEERATCPTDCELRGACYGNGMQMARRHRASNLDLFSLFLEDEIRTTLADPIEGMLVRLHVLGDFPSVEYVAMWADLLADYERLACYGYTRRKTKNWGGDEIGEAIEALKDQYPHRFRIRWSSPVWRPDGAVVIGLVPKHPRVDEGLVCPAQTDATACCASCGLCWEAAGKRDCIVFIKHGPKSSEIEAQALSAKQDQEAPRASEAIRPIAALNVPHKRDVILSTPPELRVVDPTELRVEAAYQRDLSGKSMKLIRKIVTEWDWTKFKPPICAETDAGLFIIDGQHTAIAAASHPEIKTIPVMVVPSQKMERRAEAFVAHNRDRLAMTPAQVLHAEYAAGNFEVRGVVDTIIGAGGNVPRLTPMRRSAKPGQVTAINEMKAIHRSAGPEVLDRVIRVAVAAGIAPISFTVARALRIIFTEKNFSGVADLPNQRLADALRSIKNLEAAAQHYAAESGQSRFRACALMIAKAIAPQQEAAE